MYQSRFDGAPSLKESRRCPKRGGFLLLNCMIELRLLSNPNCMLEKGMKIVLAAATGVGLMGEASVAQTPKQEPKAGIEYQIGNFEFGVTTGARIVLEKYGYSFPLVDGKMTWCLNGKECAELEIQERNPAKAFKLFIQDVVDEQYGTKEILLCRRYTTMENKEVKNFLVFNPAQMPRPFEELKPDDPLIKRCEELTS